MVVAFFSDRQCAVVCGLPLDCPAGTGTTISYEVTFTGYTGPVELLVADTSELDAETGAIVSFEAVKFEEGTEPLRGDFTLSFQGQETVALSYDSTADEVC